MRWKIIVANAGIVLIVGLLSYAMLAASLADVVANPARARTAASQSVESANARLALDALQLERWLNERVRTDAVVDVFASGTMQARQEGATAQANRIRDDLVQVSTFSGLAPSLVLFMDAQGTALGRNGSALMRGERIADVYPVVKRVLENGGTTSDVWINRQRQEQMLVSLTAVPGDSGKSIGAVAVGVPLSDERLQRTRELTGGSALLFGLAGDKGIEVVARGGTIDSAAMNEIVGSGGMQFAQTALKTRNPVVVDAVHGDWVYAIAFLEGYAGKKNLLISALPVSSVASVSGLLMPVFGATLLGLILVAIVGALLGNYFSRPISELEDGILAIINGNQSLRFQLEHAELGGLVFRINSLLNALMGVAEDTTDEQGRPSLAPTAGHFQEALSVDESSVASQQVNPQLVAALSAEPADQYYSRIFQEYLAAKQRIGDPVEGISRESFMQRIQASEREMSTKYGRPVRHVVEAREGGIVLVAVPLS